MLLSNKTRLDLNVTIKVLDAQGKEVTTKRFKNTATERMTTGIALFLAGDYSTSIPGRWRPNFMSFGTTGIDLQPIGENLTATVRDVAAFEDKAPAEGDRTRPWFTSKRIGERTDGFWNPNTGWVTEVDEHGVIQEMFQGELACPTTVIDENTSIRIGRSAILRAEVSSDKSYEREEGANGYSTDCIFFGYSSVKWNNQFFDVNGVQLNRLAISEFGLYEGDIDSVEGQNSLMAGFRVPTVDDIVYVEPDWVTLVEWRVTIRALMPYETVSVGDEPIPTGIDVAAEITNVERQVKVIPHVRGPEGVRQEVNMSLAGNPPDTTIEIFSPTVEYPSGYALVTVGAQELSPFLKVTVSSAVDPQIRTTAGILTGLITDYVTGIVLQQTAADFNLHKFTFSATVLGRGDQYDTTVIWSLEPSGLAPGTHIEAGGNICDLYIDVTEETPELKLKATSTATNQIYSVAAIFGFDRNAGSYTVSDFSILTDAPGD